MRYARMRPRLTVFSSDNPGQLVAIKQSRIVDERKFESDTMTGFARKSMPISNKCLGKRKQFRKMRETGRAGNFQSSVIPARKHFVGK